MNFSENCQIILFYWPVQFYSIIFKIDWFIAKTKRVSVQLGHSVYSWGCWWNLVRFGCTSTKLHICDQETIPNKAWYMHIIDFEKKIFLVFIMYYYGVVTHISYFFACNFWTWIFKIPLVNFCTHVFPTTWCEI